MKRAAVVVCLGLVLTVLPAVAALAAIPEWRTDFDRTARKVGIEQDIQATKDGTASVNEEVLVAGVDNQVISPALAAAAAKEEALGFTAADKGGGPPPGVPPGPPPGVPPENDKRCCPSPPCKEQNCNKPKK